MTSPLQPPGERGFPGQIVTMRQLGDLGEATVLQTIMLNQAGAGVVTVFTPAVGKIFVVYGGAIQNDHTAEIVVQIQSGTTYIAKFKLSTRPAAPSDPASAGAVVFEPTGVPWLVGRVAGEALKVETTNSLIGFLIIGTRDVA